MTRIYFWLIWRVNLAVGNLFWPGLGKQGTWRYGIAIAFWSRSYGYGQQYYERWERGEVVA